MRSKIALGLASTCLALGTGAGAQAQALAAHKIGAGVYWVEGGVSNTGFVVGAKGVVAIDAQKSDDAARAVQAVIAKITPRPVETIIITHGDPDHLGGIAAYPVTTNIIEHENTRAAVLASAIDLTAPPGYHALYDGLAHGANPLKLVGGTEEVTIDGVRMQLIYVAPGHSSGDLIVYLPDRKVVFAGDVVTTNIGQFPVIHLGGSSLGWISAMRAILALDAKVIVSGHGGIETRAQLAARLHEAEARRDAVKAMIAAGKTLDEIKQALPEKGGSPMFPGFDETTYNELTKGYPAAAVAPWHNIVHRP